MRIWIIGTNYNSIWWIHRKENSHEIQNNTLSPLTPPPSPTLPKRLPHKKKDSMSASVPSWTWVTIVTNLYIKCLIPWFLSPANEVWGKLCFYTCVSFCSQGRVCIQVGGGLHRGGICIRGGGVGGLARLPPIGYYGIQSMSGRRASYWNAFMLLKIHAWLRTILVTELHHSLHTNKQID